MKLTTLQQNPHLTQQTLTMVEEAFGYTPEHQFAIDFYALIKESNHPHLHIAVENNHPVAHVGILPKMLTFQEQFFPVTLIGGVATAREKRGKGYFDKLISKVFANYTSSMGYLLWGGEDILYKKYGFHQMGVIREQKGIPFTRPPHYTPTLYRKLSPHHQQQLQNMHTIHTKNFVSLQRDWEDVENTTSCHLYIKKNHHSKITDYFFINKGKDLSGIVHEIFPLPEYNFNCWLPDLPTYNHLPMLYGCLFKIGSPDLFKKFINLYSRGAINIETITSDWIYFSFDGRSQRLKVGDFLSGIFGPGHIQEFRPFYTPLWFGGLDSI